MVEPKTFRVELAAGAERDLRQLPADAQRTILHDVRRWLAAQPFREIKTRLKKVSGFVPSLYRLRVGDYRIYYRLLADRVVILAILATDGSNAFDSAIRSGAGRRRRQGAGAMSPTTRTRVRRELPGR